MPQSQSIYRFVFTYTTCKQCMQNTDQGRGLKRKYTYMYCCISHTKIWPRGQSVLNCTCTCVIENIQTARAKYCLFSFIYVSKEVAKATDLPLNVIFRKFRVRLFGFKNYICFTSRGTKVYKG
jgi:hypothetical protein